MAYIKKRNNGSWRVRVTLGLDANGRRRVLNRTVASEAEAKALARKFEYERDRDLLVPDSRRTVRSYLEEWLELLVKPRVSERTHRDYGYMARQYLLPALGERRLDRLRAMEIQRLYARMLERGLSPRTIQYAHSVLRAALGNAVKHNLITRNPAELVDLPRKRQREPTVWSPEELRRFFVAAGGSHYFAFFVLLAGTGLRPSEAAGLRWSDVDVAARHLRVVRTLKRRPVEGGSPGRREVFFDEPKTAGARRKVVLGPSLVAILLDHREAQEARLRADGRVNVHGLVFTDQQGNPLDLDNVRARHFRPILERSGLPGVRLYDLRHAHATALLLAGENPKTVAERLGHSTTRMTLDVYSHVLPDTQRQTAEVIDALLFGVREAKAPN